MKPSYFALSLGGILLAVFLYVLAADWHSGKNLDYPKYFLILLASIAFGVHGLGHAYAEVNFNYNPLEKWQWTY